MPSLSAVTMLGFAGLGGAMGAKMGWNRSGQDATVESPADRFAYAGSSSIAGMGAGLGLGIGALALRNRDLRRVGTNMIGVAGSAAYSGIRGPKTMNLTREIMSKMGREKFGWGSVPKMVKGPISGLLLAGAAIAGIGIASMTNRDTPPADNDPQPQGQTVRERMGMIGASGDMVFGLNNVRHG